LVPFDLFFFDADLMTIRVEPVRGKVTPACLSAALDTLGPRTAARGWWRRTYLTVTAGASLLRTGSRAAAGPRAGQVATADLGVSQRTQGVD